MKDINGQTAFLPVIAKRAHTLAEQTYRMRKGVFELLCIHKHRSESLLARFPKVLLMHLINGYLWDPSKWGRVSTRMTKEENTIYKTSRKRTKVEQQLKSAKSRVSECDRSIVITNRKISRVQEKIDYYTSRKDELNSQKDKFIERKNGAQKKARGLKRQLVEIDGVHSTQVEVYDTTKKLKLLIESMTPEERQKLSAQISLANPEKE
jgi:hypothetical protein